jgi:hypothetical protein
LEDTKIYAHMYELKVELEPAPKLKLIKARAKTNSSGPTALIYLSNYKL